MAVRAPMRSAAPRARRVRQPRADDLRHGRCTATPDIGGEILYMCYASGSIHGGLFLLNASSGQVRRLTPDNAWNVDASWAPDGRRIVYSSTRDGRSDVYEMDISTANVRRLIVGRGFNR